MIDDVNSQRHGTNLRPVPPCTRYRIYALGVDIYETESIRGEDVAADIITRKETQVAVSRHTYSYTPLHIALA